MSWLLEHLEAQCSSSEISVFHGDKFAIQFVLAQQVGLMVRDMFLSPQIHLFGVCVDCDQSSCVERAALEGHVGHSRQLLTHYRRT